MFVRSTDSSSHVDVAPAKRPRLFVTAYLTLAFCAAAVGEAQEPLTAELARAFADLPHSRTQAGACVIELDTGQVVFASDADEPLIPASSMKVVTMAAALTELGAGFHFETILATDGRNLIVIGDGDPAFGDERIHRGRNESVTSDFERWAMALRDRGMRTITGDLVIDESIFDDRWLHPTWEASDLDNWYAAPVGGLNLNDNCIDITVSPAARAGDPVQVSFVPENSLVTIVNDCTSGGSGTPILHHHYDTYEYRIRGRCNKRWPFGSVSFPDPGLLFADSLRTVLAKKGIRVQGKIIRSRVRRPNGSLPRGLTVIADRVTPLSDVLRRAGKNSQNLFAECLFKRVGYEWAKRRGASDPQGSWPLGARAVNDLFARFGIETAGLTAADGSGLSRANAASPRQLATLLAVMHRRPEGRHLYDHLAVAGVDGSLRRRLRNEAGDVHAKTGTMTGVCALAGYVDGRRGPRYTFAIIFNDYPGASAPYRRIQDELCTILANQPASEPVGSR